MASHNHNTAHDVAQHGDEHGEHTPHILPLSMYFGVAAALFFLTFITVWVTRFDVSPTFNLTVAMIVAITKASLVALFFMHLKWDTKINAVAFGGSVIFLAIFFYLTFADISTRGLVDSKQGTLVKPHVQDSSLVEKSAEPAHH